MVEQTARHLKASNNPAHTKPSIEFKRSIAVIIGINDYANGIPRLTTPVNDATRLAEILSREHGYEVHLLIENVTRTKLEACLDQMLRNEIEMDDRLLVYFAGHGIALDAEDGPAGYIIPQDARLEDSRTFLPMTDLHRWLDALKCRHMLAILDCCFAGTFRWASTRSLPALPPKIYKERYDRFIRDPAWQVLTSAAYDQKALDLLADNAIGRRVVIGADNQRHSPFALALFDALIGAGDIIPKGAGDGIITATELYLYLRDFVEVQAEEIAYHRQTPGLWPLKKHDKGEYIFLVPGRELNLEPAPPLTTENNPYLGLKSYDEKHADLFFGRDALIEKLATIVEQKPLTLVLGASGTGKSSLVKAGLLSYLRSKEAHKIYKEAKKQNRQWHILPPIRPGEHPIDALRTRLQEELAPNKDPNDPISIIVATWLKVHPDQQLLLVIDQFEELITLCRDEDKRNEFLIVLTNLLVAQPEYLHIIVTLRSDFEPQFVNSPLISHHLPFATRFIIPLMSQVELREVIEGPASVRVIFFNPPTLIEDLIEEVGQTPGALPLLSFTLEQLYLKYLRRQEEAQRSGVTVERALMQADYAALGGVIGSLRTRADEEYHRLPDDTHRATMQRVILRMVSVEAGELARRRVPLSELVYPSKEENTRVEEVIQRLVNARLVVRGSAVADSEANVYVEPAHDALVRAWDRLLVWRKAAENQLPIHLHRRLTQSAEEWALAGAKEKTDLLWDRDPRLPFIENILWPAEYDRPTGLARWFRQVISPNIMLPVIVTPLNNQECLFIQSSVQHQTLLLRRIIGIVSGVIITLSILTLFAVTQMNEAIAQRSEVEVQRNNAVQAQQLAVAEANVRATAEVSASNAAATAVAENQVATARELAANASVQLPSDPELGRLLAIKSIETLPTNEGEEALRQSLLNLARAVMRGHTWPLQTVDFSPDSTRLLTADADEPARLWEVTTGKELLRLDDNASEARFSPTGDYFITVGREVQVHDINTGVVLIKIPASLRNIQISPDGRYLLGIAGETRAELWEVMAGRSVAQLQGHNGKIITVQFSPDGHYVVTASEDATARVWELPTGKLVTVLKGHTNSLVGAWFSPNSAQILTASSDKTARLWNTLTGTSERIFTGHTASLSTAAFSPDGHFIATASLDTTVRVWTVETDYSFAIFSGQSTNISKVAFSPNGQFIATINDLPYDGVVRVWALTSQNTSGAIAHILSGNVSWINDFVFSPDSKFIATAGDDGTARVWDISLNQPTYMMSGFTSYTGRGAFDPTSKRVIIVDSHSAQIWNTQTGTLQQRLPSGDLPFTETAFSPDGRRAVVWYGSWEKPSPARLWNTETGLSIADFPAMEDGVSVALFSPAGPWLATLGAGPTVHLWNTETGQLMQKLQGHNSRVVDAAWSGDGRRLATTAYSEAPRVWDTTSGRSISVAKEKVANSPSLRIALSHDGRRVAATSGGGRVLVWDIATGETVVTLQGHGADVLYVEFSPDDSQIATASWDYTARLWDAQTGTQMAALTGHATFVRMIRYSPDGRWLITASEDGTARLWNANTGNLVMILSSTTGAGVYTAQFSPDSRHVITSDGVGVTRIYNCEICGKSTELLPAVKAIVTRDFTPSERRLFLHVGR